MNNELYPKQSFEHTLKEISVNRESPCEIVRELISNSYDAKADNILIFPLLERKGIVFFDDGAGLSEQEENSISPYVAFFSIGFGTKTKGEQIGYKCQGSKLCFASNRFALITKCLDESEWRYITIENPKINLSAEFNIASTRTSSPEKFLRNFLNQPDSRTNNILNSLDKDFFSSSFKQGTMIVLEGYEATEYEKYFGGDTPRNSYLYNYVRFYTAHGDTRLIKKEQGFLPVQMNAVASHFGQHQCELMLWMPHPLGNLEKIPRGWPYLEANGHGMKQQPESPAKVSQLRKGNFYSRHATVVKFAGQIYTLVFAIDGKRKALDGYPELGRQRSHRCGMPLFSQRGVFLSSHGVRICPYNEIFDNPLLADKFLSLKNAIDHFVFFIDGDFELITNRNQLAEKSRDLLTNPSFINQVKSFLENILNDKEHILNELLQRINREVSENTENIAIETHNSKKGSIISGDRKFFCVKNIELLKDKWFVTPIAGEEHFVGALYTLFSNLITTDHPLCELWKRPLTFSGLGIDSIAVSNGEQDFSTEKLILLEYKYRFSPEEEFNHPFSITNQIVCWQYLDIELEKKLSDSYSYTAIIEEWIPFGETKIGFKIGNIHKTASPREIGNTISVLSLEKLLDASFEVEWKDTSASANCRNSSATQKSKSRRRKR